MVVLLVILVLFGTMVGFAVDTTEGFFGQYKEFKDRVSEAVTAGRPAPTDSPPIVPMLAQWMGAVLLVISAAITLNLQMKRAFLRRNRTLLSAAVLAALGVLVAWLPTDFVANLDTLMHNRVGADVSMLAYLGKLTLVSLLILSLPLAMWLHYRSSLMDRYLVRSFLTPFFFCLLAFIGIWLIFDLIDNGPDFASSKVGFAELIFFYIVQLPKVILFVLPVTLLLSLLFTLSKMSRANELISMLGAGRSMGRILLPLFLIGVYCSLIAFVFKYEWAPRSEAYKAAFMDAINDGSKDGKSKEQWEKKGWLYVNPTDHRTWFVGRIPLNISDDKMMSVMIVQYDNNWRPVRTFRATSVVWYFGTKEWKLYNGKTYTYREDDVPEIESWNALVIPNWRETPWKVVSRSLEAEHLGIPRLTTYLRTNSDYDPKKLARYRTSLHYCVAEPFACLVMVLVSAPLGIVFSRRGVLGGVAASIIIFASMYFLNGIFLALGQGGYLPAVIAAWMTNVIYGAVGGVLLYYRAGNRTLPRLKLPKLFRSRSATA